MTFLRTAYHLSAVLLLAGMVTAQERPSTTEAPPRRHVWKELVDPSPEDWRAIENPDKITVLQIYDLPDDGMHVDDKSLENLSRFPNVRTLVLGCDALTDSSIPHLLKL